jgi:hypothetical protein
MVSPEIVRKQLDRLGIGSMPLCNSEIRQLPRLLVVGEEIEGLLAGRYFAGYSIMVATNFRLLIIDKKLGGGLIFEDIPYDMIAEVEFGHGPFSSHLTIHARSKKIDFKVFRGSPVMDFAQYLEQRMMEARNQIRSAQSPFNQQMPQENQPYGQQARQQGFGRYQPGIHLP